MPKISKIANKVTTCVSIDREKLEEAKKKGINMSLLLDEALTRELEPEAEEHFKKAIENQNTIYQNYVTKTGQQDKFDDFKFSGGQNVVEKEEPKQKIGQPTSRFEEI